MVTMLHFLAYAIASANCLPVWQSYNSSLFCVLGPKESTVTHPQSLRADMRIFMVIDSEHVCRYSTAGTKAFFLGLGEQCKQEAALLAGHPPEGKNSKVLCCQGIPFK